MHNGAAASAPAVATPPAADSPAADKAKPDSGHCTAAAAAATTTTTAEGSLSPLVYRPGVAEKAVPQTRLYALALAAVTWPDGSSRWDSSRVNRCYHCGTGHASIRRNICGPCRTAPKPFDVPRDTTSSNVYIAAGGYRWCQRNCSTLPKPLSEFPNINVKKCGKCIAGRAASSVRLRRRRSDAAAAEAAGPSATAAAGVAAARAGTGCAAASYAASAPVATKERRRRPPSSSKAAASRRLATPATRRRSSPVASCGSAHSDDSAVSGGGYTLHDVQQSPGAGSGGALPHAAGVGAKKRNVGRPPALRTPPHMFGAPGAGVQQLPGFTSPVALASPTKRQRPAPAGGPSIGCGAGSGAGSGSGASANSLDHARCVASSMARTHIASFGSPKPPDEFMFQSMPSEYHHPYCERVPAVCSPSPWFVPSLHPAPVSYPCAASGAAKACRLPAVPGMDAGASSPLALLSLACHWTATQSADAGAVLHTP